MDRPLKPAQTSSTLANVAMFVLLCIGCLWIVLHGGAEMGYRWQWYRVPQYFYRVIDGELIWGPLIDGLRVTLEITALSLLLTVAIGLGTALLRLSQSISGRILARIYLEVIRNTPLLVQLYLVYFVFSPILGLDRYWTAVLTLSLFEGAFAAEIFRAGIQSVPRGQWEAADSLGLNRFDAYRDVILPQAIRLVLPPMTGQAVSLIKHSAIVSVIAVFDLFTEARNIVSDTFMSFEIYFTVGAMYLALIIPLSTLASVLEHRLRAR